MKSGLILIDFLCFNNYSRNTLSAPKYWGTSKGQVIRAIAEKRALQYDELLSETGLEPSQLNTAIEELMEEGVLDMRDWDQHWVDNDLWHEYRAHLGDERSKEIVERRRREEREFSVLVRKLVNRRSKRQSEPEGHLRERISEWIKYERVDHEDKTSHLYLKGNHLDSLLTGLIPYCSEEVLVVNPYVEKCTLSNLLVDAARSGLDVKLISQSPAKDYEGKRKEAKIRFHETMKESGVKLYYNASVHAKMFLLDKEVLAIGSMNLYSDSTAGKLWEAGMFTVDKISIKSALESFQQLEQNIESVKQ